MRTTLSILTVPFLFTALSSALTFQCDHIRVDKKKFDLSKLGGPHELLVHDEDRPPAIYNTTYTVDICQPLRKDKKLPSGDQCPSGTHVCAVETAYNPIDDSPPEIVSVIPIAGNFETNTGKGLEPKITRLKTTDTNTEGLRVELHGGVYNKRTQVAVIEFQCDHDRTGNEGFDDSKDKRSSSRRARAAEADGELKGKDGEKEDDAKSLKFVSYGPSDDKTDVLRLDWRTKYACEDFEGDEDDEGGSKDSHWGFFTWFIILAFLGIAAYLIFGSWLNYNRYGARGWDLLPHGDTIRDIPYLFRDWSRKVVDTVQGGGTRGGYSAV